MTQRASPGDRTSGWLETLGGVALFVMMLVIFVDIVGRVVFQRPLAGSIDLVQVLLLLAAGCTLPAVTWRNEHMSVSLFEGARPTRLERVRRAVVALLVAIVFAVVAFLLWRHGQDTARNSDVIGYLRLPVSPFVYALSILFMVASLLSLALVPRSLRMAAPPAAAPDAQGAAL
jgi:TRAP-type C4-dicarboxylate transport system permease small subunit